MELYKVGKNEDAPHRSGDEGYAALVVRQDTIASLAGTDGDYSMLSVDENGNLFVVTHEDTITVSVTPTITAGAYTAGDALGGRMEFANAARVGGGWGVITKVQILNNSLVAGRVDLVLFNQTYTAPNDNDPFSVSDADLLKCLGHINIATTDYSSFANNEQATKTSGQRMPFDFVLASGVTSLFGQLIERGGETYGATDDLTVVLTITRRR